MTFQPTKYREEISELILSKRGYIEGQCFICGSTDDMEEQYYAHAYCCVAYTDDKEQRTKKIMEKYDI